MKRNNRVRLDSERSVQCRTVGAGCTQIAEESSFKGHRGESFDQAEPYLKSLKKLHHIIERVEVKKDVRVCQVEQARVSASRDANPEKVWRCGVFGRSRRRAQLVVGHVLVGR